MMEGLAFFWACSAVCTVCTDSRGGLGKLVNGYQVMCTTENFAISSEYTVGNISLKMPNRH